MVLSMEWLSVHNRSDVLLAITSLILPVTSSIILGSNIPYSLPLKKLKMLEYFRGVLPNIDL